MFEDSIVVGDCLDIMAQMPDDCVDLVVTDPPYGVGVGDWDIWNIELARQWIPEIMRVNRGSLYMFFAPKKHLWELLSLMPDDIHILAWCKNTGLLHKYAKEWEWFWEPCIYWRGDGIFNKLSGIDARDWVVCPTPWAERDEGRKSFHKAQKPKKLLAKYILASSNRGDIVFDPFIGSGTTAVVAKSLGRHWYGCDMVKKYVDIANKRVSRIQWPML